MNYAENLLSRNDDSIAITAARESGSVEHVTWRQLRKLVQEMAAAMRCAGITVGDRVAGNCHRFFQVLMWTSNICAAAIITNHITGITLALATASIGAIFSGTAPDMGAQVCHSSLETLCIPV